VAAAVGSAKTAAEASSAENPASTKSDFFWITSASSGLSTRAAAESGFAATTSATAGVS